MKYRLFCSYKSKTESLENESNSKQEEINLPPNLEPFALSEKLEFSPLRNRDYSGSYLSTHDASTNVNLKENNSFEYYDCSGAISLSSSMQTNVPHPFTSKGTPTHLNMPGGLWQQREKYTSGDLNKFHHANTQNLSSNITSTNILRKERFGLLGKESRLYSSNFNPKKKLDDISNVPIEGKKIEVSEENTKESNCLSTKQKVKNAIKEYGSVFLITHIGISLISLGCCYMAISRLIFFGFLIKITRKKNFSYLKKFCF